MLRSLIVCCLLLCLCFSGQAGKRGLKRKLVPSKAQRTRSSGNPASSSTDAITAGHEPSITDVLARKFLENKVSAKDIHEKPGVLALFVSCVLGLLDIRPLGDHQTI